MELLILIFDYLRNVECSLRNFIEVLQHVLLALVADTRRIKKKQLDFIINARQKFLECFSKIIYTGVAAIKRMNCSQNGLRIIRVHARLT